MHYGLEKEKIKANNSDVKQINDEAKSSVSLNQTVANGFIGISTFLYIIAFVVAFVGITLPSNGILFALMGSFVIFISWGGFAIIAEIYKNLKEINAKIKSPDKD